VNTRLKLILCGILALSLGLAFSIPLLLSNLKPRTSIDLIVDVKYAYFGDQGFSQNISGLWRNASKPQDIEEHLISYVIVLNITNHSDKVAYVDEFEAAAAPEILAESGTVTVISDAVVYDVRTIKYFPGWDQSWVPNQSRLVALTGTVGVFQTIYDSLINGTLYLYGRVQAMAYGSGTYSEASGFKQVQLQEYGREFLYNALISGNQLLQIENGFDVSIRSGS
jgi:hypothetical protein